MVALEQDLEGVVVAVADQRDEALVALQLEQRRAAAEQAGTTLAGVRVEASMYSARVPTPGNTVTGAWLRFQVIIRADAACSADKAFSARAGVAELVRRERL